LTTDWVLSIFSDREPLARARYSSFIDEAMDDWKSEYDCGTYEGRILGGAAFADEVLSRANDHGHVKFPCEDVLASICLYYKISIDDLRSPGKTRSFSEARAVAAMIVKDTMHLSLTKLGLLLGRDVSALGKSVLRIRALAAKNSAMSTRIEEIKSDLGKCPKL
jgi:putative transposase